MPRRIMQGVVVSDKAEKTISVRVDRRVRHPIYKKFLRKSKRYAVHDQENTARIGDTVRFIECAPISKSKSFTLLEVTVRSALADAEAAADAIAAKAKEEATAAKAARAAAEAAEAEVQSNDPA